MAGSLQWLAFCCCWRTSRCWAAWPQVSVARQFPPARYYSSWSLHIAFTYMHLQQASWNVCSWQIVTNLVWQIVTAILNSYIDPSGCSFSLQLGCQWSVLPGDPQQPAPLPWPAGWCAPHALWGDFKLPGINSINNVGTIYLTLPSESFDHLKFN